MQRTLECVQNSKGPEPSIFSCILLALCCFLLISTGSAFAKTFTVDTQARADFRSIQAAVDQAEEGDTVFVYAGEYSENVILEKSLTLIAKNREFSSLEAEEHIQETGTEETDTETVFFKGATPANVLLLPADPREPALEIRADNVTIRGFVVKPEAEKRANEGILLLKAENCILLKNRVVDMKRGIYLCNCTSCVLEENILDSNLEAVVLENSNMNLLRSNCMELGKNGIYLKASDENRLFENQVEGFSSGFRLEESEGNLIESNTANCNNLAGFYLLKARENQLKNNSIINNFQCGISLETSTENTLIQNDVQDTMQGILLTAASMENNVYGNQLFECEKGLLVSEDSNENRIYNNTINLWKIKNKSWLEELLDRVYI